MINSKRTKYLFALIMLCSLAITQKSIAQTFAGDTILRLYYTAKVWGYLKYFQPNVDGCNKNMDSILVALIPEIESDSTDSLFNASLLKMFAFAGPMPTATTPPPSLTPAQMINLNLDWQHDFTLSPSVQALLDSIQVNFRPVESCYYHFNPDSNNTGTYYSIQEKSYSTSLALTEPYRILILSRVWNQYEYFYPYKTLLDNPWDSTLMEMIPLVRASDSILSFQLTLMQLQSKLEDAHAFTSSVPIDNHFGSNYLPLLFDYIDSQTVVSKVFKRVTSVKPGDNVVSIDGTPTQTIRDSLRKYMNGGSDATLEKNISIALLQGLSDSATLVLDDGSGPRTASIARSGSAQELSDSIDFWRGDGKRWKILPGNIGYVNMGIITIPDLTAVFDSLNNSSAIIFDMRNYPGDASQGAAFDLCGYYLLPIVLPFATFAEPDANYPGTLRFFLDSVGPYYYNSSYYKGEVILLVNAVTQSAQEFQAMALSQAPNVLIVGSQTAGADGNVITATYPTNIYMSYTSIGVSFADGRQTQRIGIRPDVIVHPTIKGIRAGLDEVLDTAIILASGSLSVSGPNLSAVSFFIYPNPLHQSATLHFSALESGYASIKVLNPLGAVVSYLFSGELSAGEHSITWNVPSGLPAGAYECVMQINGTHSEKGIVIQ